MTEEESQRKLIYEYMLNVGPITGMMALELFGCFRLGARIYELRRAGIPVKDRWVTKLTEKGKKKRFKEYYIEG